MICPGCGRENEDGHKFCGYCGYRFIYADAQLPPDDSAGEEETPYITEEASIPSGEAVEEIWDSHIGEAERDWEPEKKKKSGRGKLIAVLAAAIAVIVVIAFIAVIMPDSSGDTESTYERDESLIVSGVGNMSLLDLSDLGLTAADSSEALELLDTLSGVLGIDSAEDELVLMSEYTFSGTTYYRFRQMYGGLAVYNRALVLAADEEGNAQIITENLADMESAASEPDIDMTDAIEAAEEYLEEEGISSAADDTAELCYYVPADSEDKAALLAYAVNAGTYTVYVDAAYGLILGSTASVSDITAYNADGSEEVDAILDDGTYYLYDEERSILIATYDGQSSDTVGDSITDDMVLQSTDIYFGNSAAEQALEYDKGIELLSLIQEVYDFYAVNYGQTGYGQIVALYNDGFDTGFNARGGSCDVIYPYMTSFLETGDCGFISISVGVTSYDGIYDVIGHEYTHMIVKGLGGWDGDNETDSLSEGTADIMGVLIDAIINDEDPDWAVELVSRYAYNPRIANYEDFTDEVEGHTGGTLIFHAAYLMWTGDTELASTGAIDDAELLAELWYRTILLMNSDCTFADCRVACEAAAVQMYDFGLLSASQVSTVIWAFDECGIYYAEDASTTTNETVYVNLYDAFGNATDDYILYVKDSGGLIYYETCYGSDCGTQVTLDLDEGVYLIVIDYEDNNVYPEVSFALTVKSQSKYSPLRLLSDGEQIIDVYTTFGTVITGTVVDESGSPLEGVAVTVDSAEVGIEGLEDAQETASVTTAQMIAWLERALAGEYSAVTDASGNYSIMIPVGSYDFTYELEGYETVTVQQAVSLGSNAAEDVVLESDAEASLLDVYQAYYDELMELQEEYGEWQVLEASQDTFWYLEGLCFAVLIDMDEDGLEDLVLGYYDEDAQTDYGMSGRYTVEVWTYDDQIVCAGTFESVVSNLYSSCKMYKIDGVYYLESGAYGTDRGDTVGYYYLSGTEMVLAASHDFAASEYTLYGEPATMDEFYEWWNSYDQLQQCYFLADDDEAQEKVTASADALEDTLKVLRDYLGIGDSDSGEWSEAGLMDELEAIAAVMAGGAESIGYDNWVSDELKAYYSEFEDDVFYELDDGNWIGVYPGSELLLSFYYGEMDNGERSGHGVWLVTSTSKSSGSLINHVFEGEWSDDLPNGDGVISEMHYDEEDDLYTCYEYAFTFVDGSADGYGTIAYTDSRYGTEQITVQAVNGSLNGEFKIKVQYVTVYFYDGYEIKVGLNIKGFSF